MIPDSPLACRKDDGRDDSSPDLLNLLSWSMSATVDGKKAMPGIVNTLRCHLAVTQ